MSVTASANRPMRAWDNSAGIGYGPPGIRRGTVHFGGRPGNLRTGFARCARSRAMLRGTDKQTPIWTQDSNERRSVSLPPSAAQTGEPIGVAVIGAGY